MPRYLRWIAAMTAGVTAFFIYNMITLGIARASGVHTIHGAAGCERAGNRGLRARLLHDDVAVVVELELPFEQLRVRVVADRDEQTVGREIGDLLGLHVLQLHAGHRSFGADDLIDRRIPLE